MGILIFPIVDINLFDTHEYGTYFWNLEELCGYIPIKTFAESNSTLERLKRRVNTLLNCEGVSSDESDKRAVDMITMLLKVAHASDLKLYEQEKYYMNAVSYSLDELDSKLTNVELKELIKDCGAQALPETIFVVDEKQLMKEKQLSKLRLERIGFVFQFYNLVQNLSVEDNILLPMSVKGHKKGELKDRLDEILEITGLTEKRKYMPTQLSGGQQQRVAVARAVMGSPEIILADEPTGNLDTHMSEEIMKLFAKINKEKGITFLQVTHSPECTEYGTRTIILENGRVKTETSYKL